MLKNYFKSSIRNLLKYKFISGINLAGLTIGLTCCLLILIFLLNELSYDRYNPQADQIYRVTRTFYSTNGSEYLRLSAIAPPFGPLLKNDFPDIQAYTQLLENGPTPLKYNEHIFNENGAWFADQNLFKLFSVKMLEGDPSTALSDPYSIMLTTDEAKKYFGNEDPMNKMLVLGSTYNLKVTGVYQPFPENAHFHPDILISFATLNDTTIYGEKNLQTNYGNNAFYTYIKLPPNYPTQKMISQFPAFIDAHIPAAQGIGLKQSALSSLDLQKLTDIHLYSHYDDEAEVNGDIRTVYIFSVIAFFILIIACINYMNLSTARSSLRAREIGVRKVVGAQRKELITQFLFESVLLAWVALIIAFILTVMLIPGLNQLTGQHLSVSILCQVKYLIPILLIPFIVGILSGIYPAFFLSSFQPSTVLKGLLKTSAAKFSFRKALVVVQFAISIILIICTAVVFRQLNFMMNTAPGFDKDQVVTMPYNYRLDPNYDAFRNQLLQNNSVADVTRSSRIPTGRLLDNMGARVLAGDSMQLVKANITYVGADYDFIPTYGIKMLAGRNFSRDYPTDTNNFILNDAAIKMLGWNDPKSAVGQSFQYGNIKGKVIGVMSDFHFESMHQPITPLLLLMGTPNTRQFYGNLSVKLSGGNIQAGIDHLQDTWKTFMPNDALDYTFLDDTFSHLYDVERRERNIFSIFSCLAIFIACLGLFGLSAFTISQRFKEIGIRKVLGASVSGIVGMLSRDFLILVVVAAILSFPVAYYSMSNWLQSFAYRIQMGWWVFLVAAAMALIIAMATITFQALKAALSNPVQSIRME